MPVELIRILQHREVADAGEDHQLRPGYLAFAMASLAHPRPHESEQAGDCRLCAAARSASIGAWLGGEMNTVTLRLSVAHLERSEIRDQRKHRRIGIPGLHCRSFRAPGAVRHYWTSGPLPLIWQG